MNSSQSKITAALTLLDMGMACFQLHSVTQSRSCTCRKISCGSIGKHPRTLNGFKNATKDKNVVRGWSQNDTDFNLAVATGKASGTFVLDVDPRHGGAKSLEELESKFGKLPVTWITWTGGDGHHFWFQHSGTIIKNRTNLLPGLDIRGDGGYVVVPPSNHSSGGAYEWATSNAPSELRLATAPKWLLDLVQRPKASAGNSSGSVTRAPGYDVIQSFTEPVSTGNRNSKIASLAGHLLGKHVDPYVACELLLSWNQVRARPPLNREEVVNVVRSIARLETKKRIGN